MGAKATALSQSVLHLSVCTNFSYLCQYLDAIIFERNHIWPLSYYRRSYLDATLFFTPHSIFTSTFLYILPPLFFTTTFFLPPFFLLPLFLKVGKVEKFSVYRKFFTFCKCSNWSDFIRKISTFSIRSEN